MTFKTIVLRFSFLILLLNGAWAFLTVQNGYEYGAGMWASLLVYMAAGFVAARHLGQRDAMLAGASIALVEATAGFALAYALGAYGTIDLPASWWPVMLALFAVTLPLVGAAFGALGALPVRVSHN